MSNNHHHDVDSLLQEIETMVIGSKNSSGSNLLSAQIIGVNNNFKMNTITNSNNIVQQQQQQQSAVLQRQTPVKTKVCIFIVWQALFFFVNTRISL